MKKTIYIIFSILIISCSSKDNNTIEEQDAIEVKVEKKLENALDSIHPNNLSKDLSWIVNLDINEGFLQSFTITYQSGEEITKKVDDLGIGGVDYPDPYFIDDTTYYVPNIGTSKNGHYEMYIYYSGNVEYREITP